MIKCAFENKSTAKLAKASKSEKKNFYQMHKILKANELFSKFKFL